MPPKSSDKTKPPVSGVRFTSPPPDDITYQRQVVPHLIEDSLLDSDAVKVVLRLQRHGHEAYLVGGCIRDILLDRKPKDFDITTSAHPGEIKKLFRNSRLIGRRFRLIHLYFKHGKIIEVATFRRGATDDDDITHRHAAGNLYGNAADDAIRRDFTINALMYDPHKAELHDYVGGLSDIDHRRLDTIGAPDRRFREDSARLIRAVRIAVINNLSIADPVLAAMKDLSPLIAECNPDRLTEEFFKLLRCGTAAPCLELLDRTDLLNRLLPVYQKAKIPTNVIHLFVQRLDQYSREYSIPSDAIILGLLLYPVCRLFLFDKGDISARMEEMFLSACRLLRFPKGLRSKARQILVAQRRLIKGPVNKRIRRLADREYAPSALALMQLVDDHKGRSSVDEWERLIMRRAPRESYRNNKRRKKSK